MRFYNENQEVAAQLASMKQTERRGEPHSENHFYKAVQKAVALSSIRVDWIVVPARVQLHSDVRNYHRLQKL
jgi:hypothetical protein